MPKISEMYPLVEVPDLLREVHKWTGFADQFTHVRTDDIPRNVSAMLAGVLADATNLGPKRMASASTRRVSSMALLRDERSLHGRGFGCDRPDPQAYPMPTAATATAAPVIILRKALARAILS